MPNNEFECVRKCTQTNECQQGNQICASHLCTGLFWSDHGTLPGKHCVQWLETADPHGWDKNYLCTDVKTDLTWSSAGKKPGVPCTAIIEPSDPAKTWDDNFLCGPWAADLHWSNAGKLTDQRCLSVNVASEPTASTWQDNYLCWNSPTLKPIGGIFEILRATEQIKIRELPIKP
jgi:hypothetical protein